MIDPKDYAVRLIAIDAWLTIEKFTTEEAGNQFIVARLRVRENGVTRAYESAYEATDEGERQLRQAIEERLSMIEEARRAC